MLAQPQDCQTASDILSGIDAERFASNGKRISDHATNAMACANINGTVTGKIERGRHSGLNGMIKTKLL